MSILKLQRNQKVFCTSFPCDTKRCGWTKETRVSQQACRSFEKDRKKKKLISCHRIFPNLHGLSRYQIRMTFEVNVKWHTHTCSILNEEWETYRRISQTILVVAKLKKPQQNTNRVRMQTAGAVRVGLLKYCTPPKDYHIHIWKRKWWFREKRQTKMLNFVCGLV